MATTRTATTHWEGSPLRGRRQGHPGVLRPRHVRRLVARARRGGQRQDQPEELIAAAHSACFSMALSNGLAKAGHAAAGARHPRPTSTSSPATGITGIHLTVRRHRSRASTPTTFVAAAEDAKAELPGLPGADRHHDHAGRQRSPDGPRVRHR